MKKHLIICLLLICSSCALLLKSYGVVKIKGLDKAKCEAFLDSIDFKNIEIHTFYGDTTSFLCVNNLGESKAQIHNLYQPIQILYFQNDTLVSYHINCYVKPKKGNLNWNFDGQFEQFTPKTTVPLDSMSTLFKQYANCMGDSLNSQKKYQVIIYWTRMLEKFSKGAIETVINNITRFNKSNETVIYLINNDISFSHYVSR